MYLDQFVLLVAEATLVAGLLLLLFHRRDDWGLTPLFVALGVFQHMQVVLEDIGLHRSCSRRDCQPRICCAVYGHTVRGAAGIHPGRRDRGEKADLRFGHGEYHFGDVVVRSGAAGTKSGHVEPLQPAARILHFRSANHGGRDAVFILRHDSGDRHLRITQSSVVWFVPADLSNDDSGTLF